MSKLDELEAEANSPVTLTGFFAKEDIRQLIALVRLQHSCITNHNFVPGYAPKQVEAAIAAFEEFDKS